MNTSQSIYKDKGDKPSREEKAAAEKASAAQRSEEHNKPAPEHEKAQSKPIRSGDTVVVSAAGKPGAAERADAPAPKAKPEDKDARLLRVLKTARERLQATGMPELDVEVDELIAELGGEK